MTGNIESVRNLCLHQNELCSKTMTVNLKPHETVVYKIVSDSSEEVINRDDKGEFKAKPLNKISMEEAQKLISDGAYIVAYIVDVRSRQEYEKKHLGGVINILPIYTQLRENV